MKRRLCIASDDDDDDNSSMPSWSGKNNGIKVDTLLEKLIDSVLFFNDKLEGLSNRVNTLEEKVNEEIMLGRKERTEFMNEVKSELAKLKKSQEEEHTVFVNSHLVSKLSNLQKPVEDILPVDIASSSEGWSPETLDVQEPSGWDKNSDVQQPNEGLRGGTSGQDQNSDVQHPNEGLRSGTSGQDQNSDVQQPNEGLHSGTSWQDKNSDVQQPNEGLRSGSWMPETSPMDVQEPNVRDKHFNKQKPKEGKCSGSWRPGSSHLDVQQPTVRDKHLNMQKPNGRGSWLNVQQPNQDNSYLNMSNCDKSNITSSEDRWRPPGENVTKVNVGVVVSSWDRAACGVVARDHLAEFKGCCTEFLSVHSFVEGEAEAFLSGVKFAVSNDLKNVIIEGDAQNIITILNDANHPVPFRIKPVIKKIRQLASSIRSIKFKFIKKSGNMVAHTLASYAKSDRVAETRLSSPPHIITKLLNAESCLWSRCQRSFG
ncbi:hypothetical protein C5167_039851 [Papaver somniferum]|uniref:RNase H type-1 domain-containing protein n=1 Tax=Papaver somniferum TaxID=3469 RepID=A0A4Y7IDJ6_PAPSO|nr:uncharacterized protein LOC113334978 [Papaver somniferum]RZC46914.1 hypothetical protein C5167_039851 [Papaver somniferum]